MPRERRAAIYLRVSSDEQTYENQRPDVRRLVRTRGYKVVASYEEQASAAKVRSEYTRMMGDAHRGMFDVLVVWVLDRFGRSTMGNIQAVLKLDRRGVEVVSVREPWLDAGGGSAPAAHRDLQLGRPAGTESLERAHEGRHGASASRWRPHRGRVDVRRVHALRTEGSPARTTTSRQCPDH